jgi:hypothetical protein
MNPEAPWVLLEACPDPLSAQVLYGRLEAEGIPARLSSLSPIPGLAQSAEVHVPRAWLTRARACLAAQPPSEEELAALAECTAPESGEGEP